MEATASVRKALSGSVVPSAVTTVALRPQTEDEDTERPKRTVLDEEEYIEVNKWTDYVLPSLS